MRDDIYLADEARTSSRDDSGAQTLNRFFAQTYAWMATALAVSATTAYGVASNPAITKALFQNQLALMLLMFGSLGLAVFMSARLPRMSAPVAGSLLMLYAAMQGAMLSSVLLVFSRATLVQAFVVTAASFASLATYGALTKRPLAGMQQFLMMGLFGVILASVINLFLHSPQMDFVLSCCGVVVFAGLTAWRNQALRYMFLRQGGAGNLAIQGAFSLYLDFLNLFLFILRLSDRRR